MKRRTMKKGFTIIELVIVIAVVGILTAILIPTFVNLNHKAEAASQQSFLKNVNTQLAMRVGEGEKLDTPTDAMDIAKEMGFDVEKISPIDGNDIVYDNVAKRFALMNGENVVYSDGGLKAEGVDLWRIADSAAKAAAINAAGNSIFAKEGWVIGDLAEIHVGFDAGYNLTANTVSYVHGAENPAQTVIIRTLGGNLDIDAPNDTVKHYANAAAIDIEAIAGASYHEFGYVTYIEIKKGRVVAEDQGVVETVYVTGTEVEIKKEEGGEVNLAYAASTEIAEAIAEASDVPTPVVEPGVDVSNFVARTSANGYETLAEAIEAAPAADEVVLLKDVEIDHTIALSKAIKINGRGHKIKGAAGCGVASGDGNDTHSGFFITLAEAVPATIAFEDIAFEDIGNYQVIGVANVESNNGLTLSVTNVKMSNYYQSGFWIARGAFIIDGCVIDGLSNSGVVYGNAISGTSKAHPSVVGTIKNTKITNSNKESAKWAGAGINFYAPCNITIDNCEINDCCYAVAASLNASTSKTEVAKFNITNTTMNNCEFGVGLKPSSASVNRSKACAYDVTIGAGNKFVCGCPVYGEYNPDNCDISLIINSSAVLQALDPDYYPVEIWQVPTAAVVKVDGKWTYDYDAWVLDPLSRE